MIATTTQIVLAVCFAVLLMTVLWFVPWFPRKERGFIDGPISSQ